jgi:hypothetical protein
MTARRMPEVMSLVRLLKLLSPVRAARHPPTAGDPGHTGRYRVAGHHETGISLDHMTGK